MDRVARLNARELELGITESASWHREFKDSAYVYVGGLDAELNEGDVVRVFSQFGRVVDLNLARDRTTGRSRGFAFLAYEDQRSTVLAVDNLSGITLNGRTLRVDHVKDYKPPKQDEAPVVSPPLAAPAPLPEQEQLPQKKEVAPDLAPAASVGRERRRMKEEESAPERKRSRREEPDHREHHHRHREEEDDDRHDHRHHHHSRRQRD